MHGSLLAEQCQDNYAGVRADKTQQCRILPLSLPDPLTPAYLAWYLENIVTRTVAARDAPWTVLRYTVRHKQTGTDTSS